VDLRAYDVWRGSKGDELRVRSAGDGVGCAPTLFHIEGLAEDALLDIYKLVIFLVDKVGGYEEGLYGVEFAAVCAATCFRLWRGRPRGCILLVEIFPLVGLRGI
jgi:hypothetical protein